VNKAGRFGSLLTVGAVTLTALAAGFVAGELLGAGATAASAAPLQQESPAPAAAAMPALASTGATSCERCHFDEEMFEPDEIELLAGFHDDTHAEVGLSCHDCHGGNPAPELWEDYVGAKDEDFAANPYRGRPDRLDVPTFCGTCHSDAAYMRQFNPAIRVDQESEYHTSRHGIALAAGDSNVATCTDCHGSHGILRVSDPESAVYPTRVAETCSACHADADRMNGYTLVDGRPLPVDQFARWQESVHAAAMFEREDLSAPTCNDCHGNHGASPPGIDSISFVCGQCHGREATIFRESPKRAGFEEHAEFLAEADGEGCVACHDVSEPAAAMTGVVTSFGECAACHGNHGVVRPTMSFLSPLPDTPCAFCHASEIGVEFGEATLFESTRDELLGRAEELGLEGEDRFDWLVDRAVGLSDHAVWSPADEAETPGPEFLRLLDKFRIGKTSYSYEDPVTGELVRAPILRCSSCHAGTDLLGEDAAGAMVAEQMLGHSVELTARTAGAERTLLRAKRGGVHTHGAALDVDRAIDAQISLETLVHAFTAAEDSEFAATFAEGMEYANAAQIAGDEALLELGWRRRGLALALASIVFLLIGLAFKIHEISEREERANRGDGDATA
jgi:hypothetical protein